MSPWTVLGWMAVVFVGGMAVIFIAFLVLVLLAMLFEGPTQKK